MKYSLLLVLLIIYVSMNSFNSMGRAEVADSGNTGAPGEDGLVCANCHLGGPYGPVTESIKLIDVLTNLEQTSYTPGKTYRVEITVEPTINAARYGFQATVLDQDTLDVGVWMNPSNVVQIDTAFVSTGTGKRAYIEHHIPGFVPTFQIDWQAPLCDIGPVTFYFIGNAVNNDMSTSGDVGSIGSFQSFPSFLPSVVTIDSSAIPGGTYLASDSILISGGILSTAEVTLGSSEGAIVSSLQVDSSGILEVYPSQCLE